MKPVPKLLICEYTCVCVCWVDFLSFLNSTAVMKMALPGPFYWWLLQLTRWFLRNQSILILTSPLLVLLPGLVGHPWRFNWNWPSPPHMVLVQIDSAFFTFVFLFMLWFLNNQHTLLLYYMSFKCLQADRWHVTKYMYCVWWILLNFLWCVWLCVYCVFE